MQIVKEIYLDFYQSEPVLVTAKQGDVGRYLKVTLLDNGNIFTVPSGATATFSRDDVWNGCTVNDDGTILAPITADMRPGKVPAQIEISSGSDHLSSWNFILDVQFSARNDDAIEGNNDFSALNTLLDQVQTAINNTNEAIANVNAAIADMGTNFTSLANNQSISQLATNSKTLVGGINELNSNIGSIRYISKTVPYDPEKNTADAIMEFYDEDYDKLEKLRIYICNFIFGYNCVLIIQTYHSSAYCSILALSYGSAPIYLRKNNGTWLDPIYLIGSNS